MPRSKALLRELRSVFRRELTASTLEAARDLLKERPRSALAWFRLGGALADMARHKEALKALHHVLRHGPADERHLVHWRIADLHKVRGEFTAALRHYRRAVALDPGEAGWRIRLGGLLARMGRLRDAESVHRGATRCRRGNRDEAFLNLGLVLRAQERYAEAKKCFERAIRIDPKYREARHALRDVERVLNRDP